MQSLSFVKIALFGIFIILWGSIVGECQTYPSVTPLKPSLAKSCAPEQPKLVTRTVNVAVPVPQPPVAALVPQCSASQVHDPKSGTVRPNSVPVRLEVAVRGETSEQKRAVPVVYRDPGFLRPLVGHTVGLVGAIVAAPFRVAEMMVPLDTPPLPRVARRSALPCGSLQAAPLIPPSWAPVCPKPMTQPQSSCAPSLTCAPAGPSVAPLPAPATPPSCGPFMPPALVERYEEMPCAPQSLVEGLIQFTAHAEAARAIFRRLEMGVSP